MYFKYKDIDLYYEKYGSGKAELVILPGWGDTRNSWSYIINLLSDYYTIYTLDYPGFGNTLFPHYDMTIYDYTCMIKEWLDFLKLENPTLLGHSFGGRILITLTGYYHDSYPKLILMNAAGIKPKKTLRTIFRKYSYKFLMKFSNILPNSIKKKFKNYLFEHFASSDYKNLLPGMRKTFQNIVSEDLSGYLEEITSQTLILWGEDDTATPIQDAYLMRKKIKNSKLYVFKNTSHFTYLEQPIQTIELIAGFIEK